MLISTIRHLMGHKVRHSVILGFAEINEEGLNIYVGLTSKNVSIGKFYTGEWISKWRVNKD